VDLDILAGAGSAQVSGNTFPCGLAGGYAVGGDLNANLTLGAFGPFTTQTSFRVTEGVTVKGGVSLTVSAGKTLVGQGSAVVVEGTRKNHQRASVLKVVSRPAVMGRHQ
jgi:hypothetical protein